MEIAIVTGASSGLGREYVQAVADKLPNLDEIWIVARRKERLIELAQSIPGQRFRILPYDLTDPDCFRKLHGLLAREKPDVHLLINDAGYLCNGPLTEVPIEKQRQMVALNVVAPMVLVNTVLPYVHRGDTIINVSSVGGFSPSPNMVVYGATKSFLSFYTKGLHAELRHRGIHVLALEPGNMHTALYNGGDSDNDKKSIVGLLPFLDLPQVTRRSLTFAQWGWMVYTPRMFYKAYRVLAALVPDAVLSYFIQV